MSLLLGNWQEICPKTTASHIAVHEQTAQGINHVGRLLNAATRYISSSIRILGGFNEFWC